MATTMANRPRPFAQLNSRELMDEIRHRVDLVRIRMASDALRIPPPPEVLEFTSRTIPQPPDTVRICPAHTEYMVIGTHQLKQQDEPREPGTSIRKGMLIVMPVTANFEPRYPGHQAPLCDTIELPAGIEDIQFHPQDPELLGVALTNAKIHFFRLIQHIDVVERQVQFKLIDLGDLVVVDDYIADNGKPSTPVVHRFAWTPDTSITGLPYVDAQQMVTLVASTEYGDVVLVQAGLPMHDLGVTGPPPIRSVFSKVVHKHNWQAWCTASGNIASNKEHMMIVSGGDDSTLRGSILEFTPMGDASSIVEEPSRVFQDSKSHGAGITAIQPLEVTRFVDNPDNPDLPKRGTPILTGSYDDHLRLFIYEPVLRRKKLLQDVSMGSAVWRIELMDEYTEVIGPFPEDTDQASFHSTPDGTDTNGGSTITGNGSPNQPIEKRHFILLLDCYLGGVKIVRLTHIVKYHLLPESYPGHSDLLKSWGYKIEVIAHFQKGHESFVYGVDFRKEYKQASDFGSGGVDGRQRKKEVWSGAYTVVSVSMYDCRVCVWKWQDSVLRVIVEKELAELERRENETEVRSFTAGASDEIGDSTAAQITKPSTSQTLGPSEVESSKENEKQKGSGSGATGGGFLSALKKMVSLKGRNKDKKIEQAPTITSAMEEDTAVSTNETKGFGAGLLQRAKSVSLRRPQATGQSEEVQAKRRSLAL